jgi:hypothetical protein
MGSMTDLQTIRDLRAAATPGPQTVDVIDDHSGTKTWLICDLARERYGWNAVSFGEDEGTAKFVAAAFTVVPEVVARLEHIDELVAQMEDLVEEGDLKDSDFAEYAAVLREALSEVRP